MAYGDVFVSFAKVVINKKPPIVERAVHEVEPIRPVAPRMRTHVVGGWKICADYRLWAIGGVIFGFVQFVLQFFLEDDWMLTN